ncbi:MAG TPA: hypothetical protein VNN09_14300 [Candidatus Competibacteraceae bacterium]|nr:hypothetical protein [Candidatus Competibacteraceae bacterium]
MTILLQQLLALLGLIAALWLGHRHWIAPRAGRFDAGGRVLLGLVLVAFLGGLLGSPFWWLDAPQSFAWDLPPLASRLLAAAGFTFALLGFLALRRPTAARLRLVNWLLAVYLLPLVAAILLFHLDRFDPHALITWAFFTIAAGMSVTALGLLLRPPALAKEEAAANGTVTNGWFVLTALVMGLWGLALLVTDHGPLPWVWAWSGDALSTRVIAVMLLAIAAGSLYALRAPGAGRLMLAGMLAYGVLGTAASLWNLMSGKPLPVGYVSVFAALALGAAVLLLAGRASAQYAGSGDTPNR